MTLIFLREVFERWRDGLRGLSGLPDSTRRTGRLDGLDDLSSGGRGRGQLFLQSGDSRAGDGDLTDPKRRNNHTIINKVCWIVLKVSVKPQQRDVSFIKATTGSNGGNLN